MGDQKKALQSQNEALAIIRLRSNPAAEAKVQNDIGLTYSAMGEKAKALEAFQKVLEIAKANKDIQQQSATLNNLARLHQDFGDNKEAQELYTESLALVHETGDRSQEAATLAGLAMLYHSLGNEQDAIDTLNESIAKHRSIEDRHGEAVALSNLGIVYGDTGEIQKALEIENSALSIFRDLDSTAEVAGALANRGSIYRSLGLYERAQNDFSQALEIQKQTADEDGEAATLNNLGVVMQDQGEPREALREFEQALQLVQNLGNRIAHARLLASMAIASSDAGDSGAAIEKLNQSLQIARETGDMDDQAVALHNLGSIYGQLGKLDQALELYGQALNLWHEIRNESAAAKVLSLMAKAERTQGRLELALSHIDETIRINESLRGKLTSQDLRTSFLATVANPYEIKIELLMQLYREHPERGYIAQGLETSERARARSLLELLGESGTDIRQGVDPELLAQERAIQHSLNAKASELRKLSASSDDGAQVRREMEESTAEYERIEAQIRIKSPAYAALMQPQPLTLEEIQSQVLDADTLLLEYSLGEERSYLWAVTQTSVSFYELPSRSEIEADAEDYFDLVAHDSQNRADLEQKAASLSGTLLGPVAPELKEKRLLIVADGELENIPFAALPVPSSSRLLVADHEILNEPSASAVAILRRETNGRKIPRKLVAVLADPVFDSGDARLQGAQGVVAGGTPLQTEPSRAHEVLESVVRRGGQTLSRLRHTRDEAMGILSLTTPEQSVALLDFRASKDAAEDPDLANYRVVHFATHGLIDLTHPELSGLVLSLYDDKGQPVDGFLRLNEIFNLRLPAQLVVLSACQSGEGKLVKGEGLLGLTRGFMYAGAASLVVSHWEVDDAATTELMLRFYKGLFENNHLHPTAALRAAQLSMIEEGKWTHPYYWAPFVVEGEWR
ncbi:MAG TPA: CHAT domain-containing tetratricopeptide repeat protein, partial [Chthoniobacterales bacterium]|nr:CHAT domain-containing tetratricopeptide repeat protein [Chthoniobacterales bacterium]